MFKKVKKSFVLKKTYCFQINAKEKVVGWYTTGVKYKPHDLEINEVFRKYTLNPTLVIIDVEHSVKYLKCSN